MIRLDVEEYCQSCLDFTAEVIDPPVLYSKNGDDYSLGDTIVRCEYRKRCAGIKRYLESKAKESKDD